jgi:hypothetical protein
MTMRKKNISVADEHSVEYLAYIFFLKRDNKAKATDSFIEWKHLIYTFSRSIFVSRWSNEVEITYQQPVSILMDL